MFVCMYAVCMYNDDNNINNNNNEIQCYLKLCTQALMLFQFSFCWFSLFRSKEIEIGQDFDFENNHFTYIIGILVLWTHVGVTLACNLFYEINGIDRNLNQMKISQWVDERVA